MAKRAFCVGINDYPYDGSDLKGCVNDASAWADVLVEHFDFPRSEVALVTDAEATKSGMMEGVKNLLSGASSGDVLVFTNSSHGSYLADRNRDELKYDEILCPYDIAENALVDDELRELFGELPDGARLTVISDSCFSGTVTRAPLGDNIPGLAVPDERAVRFLNPALRGDPVLPNPWKAKPNRPEKYPQAGMKEVLLSGSSDKEYSYDANIGGTFNGAMTYHAIKAIREADYELTYADLHERLQPMLDEAGFPQHPQLEGKDENKARQIFI
jgi:metacaspase-1